MQQSVDCDVTLDPKKIKVFCKVIVGGWVSFEQKMVVLGQEMQIKKLSSILTSGWRHQPPYNTHPEMVINLILFDVCTSNSFRVIIGHVHKYAPACV